MDRNGVTLSETGEEGFLEDTLLLGGQRDPLGNFRPAKADDRVAAGGERGIDRHVAAGENALHPALRTIADPHQPVGEHAHVMAEREIGKPHVRRGFAQERLQLRRLVARLASRTKACTSAPRPTCPPRQYIRHHLGLVAARTALRSRTPSSSQRPSGRISM